MEKKQMKIALKNNLCYNKFKIMLKEKSWKKK